MRGVGNGHVQQANEMMWVVWKGLPWVWRSYQDAVNLPRDLSLYSIASTVYLKQHCLAEGGSTSATICSIVLMKPSQSPALKGGITPDGADEVKAELQLTMVASEEQV